MAETLHLAPRRWGEALRRHRLEKRAQRFRIAGAAAAGILGSTLAGTMVWPPRALFVWNASASSPTGLYQVSDASGARAGDMVVAWPPPSARRLAAERRYLPNNVPLVKSVAAAGGDRVCALGAALFVNGRLAALRHRLDASGRTLPWWTGCADLHSGDLFLLAPQAQQSFDGRYFGITAQREVIGKARLIWPH